MVLATILWCNVWCEQAVEQVLYNGHSWYKPATELTYVTLTHC